MSRYGEPNYQLSYQFIIFINLFFINLFNKLFNTLYNLYQANAEYFHTLLIPIFPIVWILQSKTRRLRDKKKA